MEAPHLERKLVAIFAADVEGFSRHMERDETTTLAVLSSHRILIDRSIGEHGGRITGTAGDSVLAEFGSVLSAVNCAVQIQQLLAEENAKLEPDHRLLLRIGVNIGDVMIKDGDIFGDGVNIAARLETLSEPGGICVSRGVRDHLRKHRIVVFDDLGEQKVKNIAEPVRAFKIRIGEKPGNAVEAESAEELAAERESLSSPMLSENVNVELSFWDTIKESVEAKEFEIYLERFPQGSFVELARVRRDALLRAHGGGSQFSAVTPTEDALGIELAFWDAARESGSETELKAYVERYPTGQFIALAQARIEALAQSGAAKESRKIAATDEIEVTFWDSIKDSGNPEMYRAYLRKYPKGEFAELAQINIKSFTSKAEVVRRIS